MKHVLMAAAGATTGSAGGATKEVAVEGRELNTSKSPEHGNPTESQPLGQGEGPLGVRVGSEATVESGLDPVLPATGGLSDATRVRNKDLIARDEKEIKRRGLSAAARPISASFEGLMMIEILDEDEKTPTKQMVSGSFTGFIPERGVLIRPLNNEELAQFQPDPNAGSRRASDLVTGSGTGGGGNPMHAGDTRGTSSFTAKPAGGQGVTSKAGASPAPLGSGPQGGGSTTRG